MTDNAIISSWQVREVGDASLPLTGKSNIALDIELYIQLEYVNMKHKQNIIPQGGCDINDVHKNFPHLTSFNMIWTWVAQRKTLRGRLGK